MKKNINEKQICMYCKKQYIHDNPAIRGKGAQMCYLKNDHSQKFHRSCYNYNNLDDKSKNFDFCFNCGKGIKAGNVVYINQTPFGSTCARNINNDAGCDLIYNKVYHRKVITPMYIIAADNLDENLRRAFLEQNRVYNEILSDKKNYRKYFQEAKKDVCKIKIQYLSSKDKSLNLTEETN